MPGSPSPNDARTFASHPTRLGLAHYAAFGLLFVFLVSAKLWISERFATDLPNWDQWDAEGLYLLLPWQQGTLTLADLFAPHNEHRIALTKLWAIALVELNGQWDARIQMLFNGAIHSLIAVGLWVWLQSMLSSRWTKLVWVLALIGTFAPPHAWQNNLGGFHSQQYFLLGFSLLGLDRTLRCRVGSVGWAIGIASLAFALFSMASGPAAAAVTIVALLAFNRPLWESVRGSWLTLLICLAIVAVGLRLNVHFPGHESLRAQSTHDFFLSLWRALQWPATFWAPFALLIYAPWIILCLNLAFSRTPLFTDRRAHVLAAAGGWVVLQFLAAAYARGAGGPWPASRYFDTHTFGLLINLAILLLALDLLSARSPSRVVARRALQVAWVLWFGSVGLGLALHAAKVLKEDLPAVGAWFHASTRNTRLYLGTGDRQWLREPEIPYPSVDVLVERLSHPELTSLLPVSVRRFLAMKPEGTVGFAADVTSPETPALVFAPTWSSHGADTVFEPMRQWVSQPIEPLHFGYLKFEMAGSADPDKAQLELWSVDRTRRLASVRPSRSPGTTWRAAYVATPDESFRVVASDRDPDGWLAFSAPAPMATGSYWVWRLAAHAPVMTIMSGLMLLGLLPWATRAVASTTGIRQG